jgi:hypothetical protein
LPPRAAFIEDCASSTRAESIETLLRKCRAQLQRAGAMVAPEA